MVTWLTSASGALGRSRRPVPLRLAAFPGFLPELGSPVAELSGSRLSAGGFPEPGTAPLAGVLWLFLLSPV